MLWLTHGGKHAVRKCNWYSVFSFGMLDLVLQVDGAVTSGSCLCVAKCTLSSEEREKLATGRNDEELPGLDNEDRY